MRTPRQIGELLRSVLESIDIWDELQKDRLLLDWKKIIGEKIAAYAHPVRFEDGELWLVVEDPTWRMEIFNIKQELIELINRKLGENAVKRIVIR